MMINDPENVLANIIKDVLEELEQAINLHPEWPDDPYRAVAILGEEYGELVQAILQTTYEYPKSTRDDVRKEAVQTAAMAIRFLMSYSGYFYDEGDMHDQLATD